jgi:cyclin B
MIQRPASGRAAALKEGDNTFAKAKTAAAGKAGAAPRRFGTSLSVNSNTANNNAIAPAGKSAVTKPTLASNLGSANAASQQSAASAPKDNVTPADVVGAQDIDFADRFNELAVTEYVEEIYTNLRRKEMELAAPVDYMASQDDISEQMRAILIDWLIEVHLKFKLRHETLFLTVNILDRFLSVQKVARQRLQLVGVTSLMLAAKYEEIYPPEVRDYVYICDNAYTREQIVQMEQLILSKLNFRLTVPTQRSFLKRFCKAAQGDSKFLLLTSYLLELTLINYNVLKHRPSELCAAATHIALQLTKRNGWSPTLSKYTRYTEGDIKGAVDFINGLHAKAGEGAQKAAFKKYSSSRFQSVAAIPPLGK